MAAIEPKLRLPQIDEVKLRHFSLFTANPNAEVSCGNGVLCLIGANGIGKSTLLSAINFCLTGIVPDPNRPFESMEKYYKFTRAYSSRYFEGRIAGSDEEDAEIALSFHIGPFRYEVRRGLFESDELRGFTVREGKKDKLVIETDSLGRRERHAAYVTYLVEHTRVASFEEFVFLQHFVFTFDEQRKTIFWNQAILERALYRAFGLEADMAKRADNLRREIDQEDSRVRNYQWEATRMRKRINEIRAKAQATSGAKHTFETLLSDHQSLSERFEEESKALREAEDALKDASLRLAEQSVRETALRDEYARFFDRRFSVRPPLAQHPLITQSLSDHVCGICGNKTSAALTAIAKKSKASSCPLCDSNLRDEVLPKEDIKRLHEIDVELARIKQTTRDVHKKLERLRTTELKAREQFDATKVKLDEFDRQNSAILAALRQQLNLATGEASLKDYRDQLAILEKEKKTAYDQREALKRQLLSLQNSLEQHYSKAERSFVPAFAKLAQHFLGMPLSVQMDSRPASGLNLVVTVRGEARRQQQHLSESQRFFLDIALRMALTQHMSDHSSRGGMYIDTPEGSLDIAYEKRAGDMLAMFSRSGHRIIMTANLNSSQLLLTLAHECGRDGMQLCRMTDWAELSEVQQEEEALFDKAYREIEKAMGD